MIRLTWIQDLSISKLTLAVSEKDGIKMYILSEKYKSCFVKDVIAIRY